MAVRAAPPREGLGVSVPLVLPGLLALGGGLVLAVLDGGFAPRVWYPAALFLLALLVVTVVAAPPAPVQRSRLVQIALAVYALFCAWAYLSILWADSPGEAWQGANRALMYGIVFAIVALRPWSHRAALWAIALVAFGCAAIAAGVLVVAVGQDDIGEVFLAGRLAAPAAYLNATANLWLIGFWPALHLATARTLPWPVRGLGLGAATLLIEMALLSQSRGSAIAFGVTGLLYVLITPRRLPTLIALGATIALTAISFDPLIAVRESGSVAELRVSIDDAARAIAASALVGIVLGAAAAAAGRRLRGPIAARPWAGRAANVSLAAVAVGAVVAAAVAIGNPREWVNARWQDFKTSGYDYVDRGPTRFTGSLGSNRYDFYRVSLEGFRKHPVRGIGADNFTAFYLQRRRSLESPRNPHSLVFRLLLQLGIVGTALFASFLIAAVWAALKARRAGTIEEAGAVAAALGASLMWFIHAAGDWLWVFTGLGTLAFGLLAVAARVRREAPGFPASLDVVEGRALPRRGLDLLGRASGSLVGRLIIAGLALAAAGSLAMAGLSARYTAAAYSEYRSEPGKALQRLDRAAELNPLSAEPLLAKGVIAQRLGQRRVAIEALREAMAA